MSASETVETVVPVLPCASLAETLKFYRALGFEVTHEQTRPYVWGAVRRGAVDLNFYRVKGLEPGAAFHLTLVIVPEVEALHRAFVTGLREAYGKLPTAGFPRISRLRKGATRINLVDPAGNTLLFIRRDEPPVNYDEDPSEWEGRTPLERSLGMAGWLRDQRGHDDAAAAKVLDVALARNAPEPPLDYARVLAARLELAVALGETERAAALRSELRAVPLTAEERELLREELQAADELERLVL